MGVLVVVLAYVGRALSRKSRPMIEGRVTGVVGRKGHGKTLFAVHEMLRCVGRKQVCKLCSRTQGRRVTHRVHVASNVAVAVDPAKAHLFRHVRNVEDLYDLPHMTLIVLDEVQLWWPARQGGQLPPRAIEWLTQCRKLVQEVIWISQHEDRVVLGLRRLTDLIGICKRVGFGWMAVTWYQPENLRKPKAEEFRYRYRVTKRLAAAYDTYEWQSVEDDAPGDAEPAPTKEGLVGVPRSITTNAGTKYVEPRRGRGQ